MTKTTREHRKYKYCWVNKKAIVDAAKEAIEGNMPLGKYEREIRRATKGNLHVSDLVAAAKCLGCRNWYRQNVWAERPENEGYILCLFNLNELRVAFSDKKSSSKMDQEEFIRANSMPREPVTKMLNGEQLTQDEMLLVD